MSKKNSRKLLEALKSLELARMTKKASECLKMFLKRSKILPKALKKL